MKELRRGDYAFVDISGPHPAVVLQTLHSHLLIVYGTSTRRTNFESVAVEGHSEDARRLGLEWATYFYANHCLVVRPNRLEFARKRCPPELLLRLESMCAPQLAKLAAMSGHQLDVLVPSVLPGQRPKRL